MDTAVRNDDAPFNDATKSISKNPNSKLPLGVESFIMRAQTFRLSTDTYPLRLEAETAYSKLL